ncbi:hypothetical protein PSECIP111951_00898 [Pseudoalteromonas holothuriae]|uniref:F5/8 type C domain-containing protein n=1 Tax=Pseudoalteromonas holothuriae TaxID=2963714 RepID=A0A9W4VUA6_9GAMM|nr:MULTISPECIES: discoidin domain-containing protein [unclassified Pseudoalteromonas]CAH9053808.1 hypothetical protein PSECIP111951_00898 [Pseudoalteromonas sp. CIP111951]CAH9055804.1 hypothetical protein PSECIP111854_01652 [Pseudoalteromonas sp. CIP111854]
MNKAIKLATLFSSLFLTTNALAADEVWSLTTDLHLNGEVIGTSESLDARIHQGHFILNSQTEPSSATMMGNILSGTVDTVQYSTPIITFTQFRGDATYAYRGQYIGDGAYQGTWYNNNGGSGDFSLTMGQPPISEGPGTIAVGVNISSAVASTIYDSGHPASAAFDGKTGTNEVSWYSKHTEANPWLRFSTQQPTVLKSYRLSRAYCKTPAYTPGTWTLSASNDGSNWQVIDTVDTDQFENFNTVACGQMAIDYIIDVNKRGSYIDYKFDFVAASVSSVVGIGIGEVELFK